MAGLQDDTIMALRTRWVTLYCPAVSPESTGNIWLFSSASRRRFARQFVFILLVAAAITCSGISCMVWSQVASSYALVAELYWLGTVTVTSLARLVP